MFDNVSSLGTVLGQTTVFGWFGTWAIYAKSSVCSWIIRNYVISLFTSFLLETMEEWNYYGNIHTSFQLQLSGSILE